MQELLSALRAAGEETRIRLLMLLNENTLTVSEVTKIMGQSQPRISRHLKLLCDAGLLQRYQEGTWAFYRLNDQGKNAQTARQIINMVEQSSPILTIDRAKLNEVKKENQLLASKYFSQIATEWDEIRQHMVADSKVEAMMLNAIELNSDQRLLDLGTGTARILTLFSPFIKSALGIDFSHEMLTIARVNLDQSQSKNCQVRLGDIRNLPLDEASFELITIHQVLHYIDDPMTVITESARLLTPNGQLLIVDFQPHRVEQLREVHAHRRLGFSDQEVERWAAQSNLTVQKVSSLKPSGDSDSNLTVSLWVLKKISRPRHR